MDFARPSGKATFRWISAIYAATLAAGCASVSKPCSTGGEPARDKPFKGNRQCIQTRDTSGRFVNDGSYMEWHPNGRKALEGDYKAGRKHGKWVEYDESGKVISERFFDNGVPLNPAAAGK